MTTSPFLQAQTDRLLTVLGPPPPERWPDDPDALLWWHRAHDLLGQLTDDQIVAALTTEPHLVAALGVADHVREELLGLIEPLVDAP